MEPRVSRNQELKATRDALDAFLANPSLWPDLLPHRISGAVSAGTLRGHDHSGLPVIEFAMHHQGDVLHVKCNPATYAYLLSLSVIGNSFSINRRKRGSGNAHLRLDDPDNLTAARIITGLEEGADVAFVDGNSLNLCHVNIVEGRQNPRTQRNEVDAYAASLFGSKGDWGAFEGTETEQFAERKRLLHLALDCMRAERDAVLKARAA